MKALKRWFTYCPHDCCNAPAKVAGPVDPKLDFGHGFTARQLINGKWVLEVDGKGVDMQYPDRTYTWKPGDVYYPHCWIDSYDELVTKAKHAMAQRGI